MPAFEQFVEGVEDRDAAPAATAEPGTPAPEGASRPGERDPLSDVFPFGRAAQARAVDQEDGIGLGPEVDRTRLVRHCGTKKRAMIGALDCAAHQLIVNTSATKRSGDFITLLGRLDAIYGPCPGRPDKPVVFVLDNGPIHTSKASRAALAVRDWLTIEWLPKYAPELNDIESSGRSQLWRACCSGLAVL